MLQVSIKTRPKGFKSLALAAALRNLGRLPEQLGNIGIAVTAEIKQNLSGRILHRRTGNLHKSWDWKIRAINLGWELAISSEGVAYARIHEFGGWTGAGHRTYIKASRYVTRAVLAKKTQIQRILRDYVARLFWR